MSWTRLQVANMALAHLGKPPITQADLETPATESARLIDVWYDMARTQMLGALEWPFAIKTAALTGGTEDEDLSEYPYTIPSDCIRVIEVLSPADLEWREAAGLIWTAGEDTEIVIKYIADFCAETGELVIDGGFEGVFEDAWEHSSLDDAGLYGAIAPSPDEYYAGVLSLSMAQMTTGTMSVWNVEPIAVEELRVYTLEFWHFADAPEGDDGFWEVRDGTVDGDVIASGTYQGATEWSQFSEEITIPEGCEAVVIVIGSTLYEEIGYETYTTYIDELSFSAPECPINDANFVDHFATYLALKLALSIPLPSSVKALSSLPGPQLIARTRPIERRGERYRTDDSSWLDARS